MATLADGLLAMTVHRKPERLGPLRLFYLNAFVNGGLEAALQQKVVGVV